MDHDGYTGKIIKTVEGRLIKVEFAFSHIKESFYLCRWLDTNEVFCEYPDKISTLLGN